MDKKKSILGWGVVFAVLALLSLFQTGAETYYYFEGEGGADASVALSVAMRVISALVVFGSGLLFYKHKEIGRKGMIVSTYAVAVYLVYVFYRAYVASDNVVFPLIGLGNILIIALLARWLHSKPVREVVE